MKKIKNYCCVVIIAFTGVGAFASQKVRVAVISESVDNLNPQLSAQIASCKICTIEMKSLYDESGNLSVSRVSNLISESAKNSDFLFLDWNFPMKKEYAEIVSVLRSVTKSGFLVIGFAGKSKPPMVSIAISKTVLGQVEDMILIGELNQREGLLDQSFFGPQMLTAIKPPRSFENIGQASTLFVAKLAQHWNRRPASEWPDHFKNVKATSTKLWPSLEDFFR